MKKQITGAAMLLSMVISVQGAIVTHLDGRADELNSVTFTYRNLESGVSTFDRGLMNASLKNNTISGVRGTLLLTITAKGNDGTQNPLTWTFGTSEATILNNSGGWGVITGDEAGGKTQLMVGEALIVTFNLNGVKLEEGSSLVFSVRENREWTNMAYRIYQRTGEFEGAEVAEINEFAVGDPALISPPVIVGGYSFDPGIYEFAIVIGDTRGLRGMRIDQIHLDVIQSSVTSSLGASSPGASSPDTHSPIKPGPVTLGLIAISGAGLLLIRRDTLG